MTIDNIINIANGVKLVNPFSAVKMLCHLQTVNTQISGLLKEPFDMGSTLFVIFEY